MPPRITTSSICCTSSTYCIMFVCMYMYVLLCMYVCSMYCYSIHYSLFTRTWYIHYIYWRRALTRRSQNPPHAKPAARKTSRTHTTVFFSVDLYFNIGQPYDVAMIYTYIYTFDRWCNNRLNEEKSRYRAQFNFNYLLNCLLYYLWLFVQVFD